MAPFSDTADPQSHIKIKENEVPYKYLFFDGDANDSGVQAVIKANHISLLKSYLVPPFFCLLKPTCKADNVHVSAGSSGITKYKHAKNNKTELSLLLLLLLSLLLLLLLLLMECYLLGFYVFSSGLLL